MAHYEVDTGRLYNATKAAQYARDLPMYRIAEEIGADATIFSRMKRGMKPDADTLLSLLIWLRIDPGEVAKLVPETPK